MKKRLGDRIREARIGAGFHTQQKLADCLKVSRPSVSQWEAGTTTPNRKHLAAIAKAVRRPDLLDDGDELEQTQRLSRNDQSVTKMGLRIDELDTRVSSGGGAQVDGHTKLTEWEFPHELVRSYTAAPPNHIKIITVIGNSMEPLFHPTEKVLVDTLSKEPSPPGIFVLWDGIGLVLKQIEFVPHSDPGRVLIKSLNPAYGPYERTVNEAYIQGRVLGKWLWV